MIKGYQCSFCTDFATSKVAMQKHEKGCKYNPKNKKCVSCQFYEIGYIEDYCEFHDSEDTPFIAYQVENCEKHKSKLEK